MVGPEMLVAATVNQVARKINEIIGVAQGEAKLCCSFSDDLEGIKDTLVYLEGLLKNAENNSFGRDRANLRHWLGQIKSLAYDIEDMVDGYYFSKEEYERSNYAQKGSLLCSLSNPMLSKVSMVHKMKSKRELLQTRQHLPTQYHFISHINSVVNFDEKQTTSYRNNDIRIVGRDRDLEHLMYMLMQINVKELTIISIVGPVGLGKTSLAQLIFNDARAEAFRFRIWVHISMGNVNLEKIGRDIVLQTTERVEGSMQMQSIKNAVQDILNRYSCLIVLDSLWGKYEEVNELKQMLLTGRKTESKIIVTTHSSKVAELISTVPPYKLPLLSEDDCSTIFSQRAMAGHNDPLFREYGEEIVRRCEGIPLVANFLGSVVNAQRQRREIWIAAKDKDMWKIEEDFPENKIMPIFPSFKIIYYCMPHELRLCFAYCSIFPKGHVIDKKKLIQQWIALDMIESRHGTLPLDVTAEKYIDELKDIYFLQVLERHQTDAEISNTSDEKLCMNNLAHDLARSVAGEDILVILDAENERCNRNYDYRYAQVSASSLQSIDSKAWPSKARSLIFKTTGAELQHVSEVLSVNKFLRVLDISGCSVKEMPAPVFQLKQLRYLDASTLSIVDLPPQISGFHKLQTLDLSDTEVTELPAFIANLKRLNYLNLQAQCVGLKALPKSLSNRKKLQIEVLGCQDCIVQSCSLSSQSNACSEQVKEVGSSSAISHTILKESANKDVAVGITFSDIDSYPQNKLKQKLTISYHMDGHKSEDPNFINKPNSTREKVQLSPGHQFPSSPSRISSIASSSSGLFASGSFSDVSTTDNPVSNDKAGLQPEERCHEPQVLTGDGQIYEHQASSSHMDMAAHLHEATAAKHRNDNHITRYGGEYHLSVQRNGSNQGIV
ncbi:hypothetical protein BDA96_02G181900 [Sorghum bicolor]|uniref:AAA+ ATPase domain-containing protein n=2 Tax=Sorghum bicolor TaxID=4558 RepID=A0A1W0W4K0_SORBI|nr:putative disease resistance protein RGA3 isoform X3 [Sorghum bicolor]KAG0543341.1 hypothetical protein BDA96_02G181900 [Sorghum bicolor]OQU89317.1 hypothetical protein SORBI_3002G173000 [Sorghum bicolor]|eukprot:XP_021308986.1 putative disease resistance protein RGA3 isoform X3 [Sorghum bicolor]